MKHEGPNELVDALGYFALLVLMAAGIMGMVFLCIGLIRRFF